MYLNKNHTDDSNNTAMQVSLSQPGTDQFKSLDDDKIWLRFKSGDKKALVYIYQKYFPVLFHYAGQFTPDREAIKDNIQDLFIYLYKHKKSISQTNSIKFYLFKCLRRRLKQTIEHANKQKSIVFEHDARFAQSIEAEIITNETMTDYKARLQDAIRNLSAKQQEIIYYYYYQNFGYTEIAGIMGFRQVKSARKLLYRAIDALKQLL